MKAVGVNVIGFTEKERRMIRNILSAISNQGHMFSLSVGGEPADIVIVNADDPTAMAAWNEYRQDVSDTDVILASSNPQLGSDYICIKRPLIASQLHGALALGDRHKAFAPRQPKYEVLKKSFLFRNLSINHLEKVVGLSRVLTLPAQHVVFERTSVGEEMFVVLSGRLKVSVANREGREIVLGSVGEGDVIGEIAMLDGCGRSATATTLSPCELLAIHRNDFLPFLEQNPNVAIDLIGVLALRLRLNTEQLAELIAEDDFG